MPGERHCSAPSVPRLEDDPRVVFSLTTIELRLPLLKEVVDRIVENQTRHPDAVYLAVPPSVKDLPEWLAKYNETSCRPGVLHVLFMKIDYGPSSKLLAALSEGNERGQQTIIVYGDDDILYGNRIVELHLEAQKRAMKPTAFGSRRLHPRELDPLVMLEATGTVSVVASVVPNDMFTVASQPDACKYSDDFWISHHLDKSGVAIRALPGCTYDWPTKGGKGWPKSCGDFVHVSRIGQIQPLSKLRIGWNGKAMNRSELQRGNWKMQFQRYKMCKDHLERSSVFPIVGVSLFLYCSRGCWIHGIRCLRTWIWSCGKSRRHTLDTKATV